MSTNLFEFGNSFETNVITHLQLLTNESFT